MNDITQPELSIRLQAIAPAFRLTAMAVGIVSAWMMACVAHGSEEAWEATDTEGWKRLRNQRYDTALGMFKQAIAEAEKDLKEAQADFKEKEKACAENKDDAELKAAKEKAQQRLENVVLRRAASQTGLAWSQQLKMPTEAKGLATTVIAPLSDDKNLTDRKRVILARALNVRGLAEQSLKAVTAAVKDLKRAEELYARLPGEALHLVELRVALAKLESETGTPELAIAHYDQAFAQAPTQPQKLAILLDKATLLMDLGKYRAAAQLFATWERLPAAPVGPMPSEPDREILHAYLTFARINLLGGDYSQTDQILKKYDELTTAYDPTKIAELQIERQYLRARLALARDDVDSAIEALKPHSEAFATWPALNVEYLTVYGQLAFVLGNYDQAAKNFEAAMKLMEARNPKTHPSVLDLALRQAWALQLTGGREKEVTALCDVSVARAREFSGQQYASQHPLTGRGLHLIGMQQSVALNYLLGKVLLEKAVSILAVSQESLDPDLMQAEFDCAQACWSNMDFEVAQRTAESLVRRIDGPHCRSNWVRAEALTLLGFIEHSQGRLDVAQERFVVAEKEWAQVPAGKVNVEERNPLPKGSKITPEEKRVHPLSAEVMFGLAVVKIGSDSTLDLAQLEDALKSPAYKADESAPLVYLSRTKDRLLLRLSLQDVVLDFQRRATRLHAHGRKKEALVVLCYARHICYVAPSTQHIDPKYLETFNRKIEELQREVSQSPSKAE